MHDTAHLAWDRLDSPEPDILSFPPRQIPLRPRIPHPHRSVRPPAPDSVQPVPTSVRVGSYPSRPSPHLQPRSICFSGPPPPERYRQTFCPIGLSSPAPLHRWAADDPDPFHLTASAALESFLVIVAVLVAAPASATRFHV